MAARFENLLPVVLGGDIGAYALARQLHETTGSRVTLVASEPVVAVSRSAYIDHVRLAPDSTDAHTVALLRSLVLGRAPRSAVLLANTDAAATLVATHRSELEPTYVLPFPTSAVMQQVCHKVSFSRLCAEVGLESPRQVVVDIATSRGDGAAGGAQAPQVTEVLDRVREAGLAFPLVGKPAVGSEYDRLPTPGVPKIWFLSDAEELAGMLRILGQAGYTSPFLLQERIPGDDTAMRSVTAYMDTTGELRLIGSARVLLEDHAPTMIGNPVAMITQRLPSLWEGTERLLKHVGYTGFANLDIKVDPRDGREIFFEVNPRIGRNSYYLSAAGVSPMTVMLEDLLLDHRGPRQEATRQVLYSLVPRRLLLDRLRDPVLCRQVEELAGQAVDPLLDPSEPSVRRRVTVELQRLNHYRKFARYHPVRRTGAGSPGSFPRGLGQVVRTGRPSRQGRARSGAARGAGDPGRSETLEVTDAREMRIAVGNTPAAVEQTECWESFEEAMGRPLWGRYLYKDGGKPVAAIALYRYEAGGQAFLWAKHGPVWLKEQSPAREAHLRQLLRAEVVRRDRSIRFIRLHARYGADDLHELLSTITYDRTYVIDLAPGEPGAIAAQMPKDGRRAVRRAERVARESGCTISDETGLSRHAFDEVYEVLRETARRDGFSPHAPEVYWTMLTALGPSHARLFVLRKDGVPHAWDLILTSGKDAVAYYGASSDASRTFRGAEALDWWAACTLAAEGYRGLDLMGAGSTRVPSLYTVGQYKKRYARHVTEVDGAWDVPVSRALYLGMVSLKKGRDFLRGARRDLGH